MEFLFSKLLFDEQHIFIIYLDDAFKDEQQISLCQSILNAITYLMNFFVSHIFRNHCTMGDFGLIVYEIFYITAQLIENDLQLILRSNLEKTVTSFIHNAFLIL